MMRVPFSEPRITIRQDPSPLCRSLSDEFSGVGVDATEVSASCCIEKMDGRRRFGHFRNGLAAPEPRKILERSLITTPVRQSKTRETLRTVVRDLDACHFFERAVRLRGVANQSRRVPVDLVQECAIRRYPVIGRSAGDGCVETSGRAISQDFRTSWVACDFESSAVNAIAGDVAVSEVRCEHELIVRRNAEPAQFRR